MLLRSTRSAALLALLTLGCPDPNPTGAVPTDGASDKKGPDAGRMAQGATVPNDARFKVAAGEGVALNGTLVYEGTKTGRHRLDFLQLDGDSPPRLIHTVELKGLGEWSVTAPKNTGQIYIVGFIDQSGDGPSADDPAGMTPTPVEIVETDLEGVTIALSDEPDLGPLTPGAVSGHGGPPKEGAGPQPDGSPGGQPGDGPPPDGPPPDGQPPQGSSPEGAPPADGGE